MSDILLLVGQCEYAVEPELGDVIMAAAQSDSDLRPVQDIIVRRLEAGVALRNEPLAAVLSAGPSRRLWDLAWPRLKSDPWSVLRLYRAKYPQAEIEATLYQELQRVAKDDGDPLRRFIVGAISEVGTRSALPILFLVRQQLASRASASRNFGDELGGLDALKARSTVAFVKHVQNAIDAVELRLGSKAYIDGSASHADGIDRSAAQSWLNKAHQYVDSDPIGAIDNVRKGAEALAKAWYRGLGLDEGGKSPSKMMLDDLLKSIERGGAPGRLVRLLKSCQPMGNFTAHDQEGGTEAITPEDAAIFISALEQALGVTNQRASKSDP